MKTAVLYTTTYGTTQRCAEALVAAIGQGSQSFDLKRYPEPNLQEFDAVIVGASVYVGKIQPAAEAYLKSHEDELLRKPLALFLCGMQEKEMSNQLQNNFSESLKKHAKPLVWLGGAYPLKKMSFMHKLMVKTIAKVTDEQEAIRWPELEQLANIFQ